MLSTVNNYAAMVDFSGEGYQEMAVLFNRYLKNFLTNGDPNGNLFTGIRGLFSGDSALPKWAELDPGQQGQHGDGCFCNGCTDRLQGCLHHL